MVQLLAGIISLRWVLEANPGRSHSSADTLLLRHSANWVYDACRGATRNKLSNVTMLKKDPSIIPDYVIKYLFAVLQF